MLWFFERWIVDEQLLGGLTCFVEQASVETAGEPGRFRQSALACAEEVTRTPQLQVLFSEDETVVGFDHELHALFPVDGNIISEQQAIGSVGASSYSAPELVQLRQPEPI